MKCNYLRYIRRAIASFSANDSDRVGRQARGLQSPGFVGLRRIPLTIALDILAHPMANGATDTIDREGEIETLDRAWEIERATLLVRNKTSGYSAPSSAKAVLLAMFSILVGVLWTLVSISFGAPGLTRWIGLVFIAAGVGGSVAMMSKAARYRDAEQAYLRRRETVKLSIGGRRDHSNRIGAKYAGTWKLSTSPIGAQLAQCGWDDSSAHL